MSCRSPGSEAWTLDGRGATQGPVCPGAGGGEVGDERWEWEVGGGTWDVEARQLLGGPEPWPSWGACWPPPFSRVALEGWEQKNEEQAV